MTDSQVVVQVPATSANLGPGFDVLGLALPLYNTLTLEAAETEQVVLRGPFAAGLPTGLANLTLVAARRLTDVVGRPLPPCLWRIDVAIPTASGLGSSSAAIAGGLMAANSLLGDPLDQQALLELASSLEGHPDNVAPALWGGVTAAFMEGDRVTCIPLAERVPAILITATPDFPLSTAESRRVLPLAVPRADAIANVAYVTALTAVLTTGNTACWPLALRDKLHQPYRSPLIKGADAVFEAAIAAGAYGCVISGAGPTLLAFVPEERTAAVTEAMRSTWTGHGVATMIRTFDRLSTGAAVVTSAR